MEKKERKIIREDKINLPASAGVYLWFCKNIAALVALVLPILEKGKAACNAAGFAVLVRALWIVNHMANKLEGICSISSSVHDNCFCKAWRAIKDCICAHCYAHNQQSYQTGLKEHNILNGLILRNILIPIKYFKLLKIVFPYLRIESFGDVQNVIQARNYIRIIKAFPEKRCAVWTKNIEIWHKAFKAEGGKPKNTTFVISSPYLNKPIAKTILENYPEIDHIFTVYDKAYAKKHNITINCGGRKCMECIIARKNCYFRTTKENNTLYINELKK